MTLALATTAALGFAAPALAADTDMSATKAQTQAPVGQTTAPSAQTPSAQTSCIRLTNWDALALAKLVHKGTPVEFID